MYSKEEQRSLFNLSKELIKATDSLPKKAAETQIAELSKVIVYHEWRYYVLSEPVISDFEYDTLFKRLEALEGQYPDLKKTDSPTQRVSNDLTEEFNSVEHLVPMLSLANSYNAEDLSDFDKRIKEFAMLTEADDIEYVVEPKFDGGSIALVYDNDLMVRAATRGNGTKGEEMTPNARTMKSVPLSANFSKYGIQKVELRGEAVIRRDRFDKMNIEREKEGLQLFANPRNTAAGGLRTKDPNETGKRHIEAFVYQLGYAANENGEDVLSKFSTHHEGIEMLGNLGFKIPKTETKVCKNIDEVVDFCKEWEAKREGYSYEIDGMVIKVNSLEIQERCGYTSHHPRWAIAFKFKAKQATTKLLNVEYQIGKIGSITPVAKVEPVALAGVTVSSISLHNEDFITSKDLRLGDTVLIERAGDVIPYIVKSMEDLRDGNEISIEFPKKCPVCETELVREEGEAAWRCTNYDGCEAQVLQRMIFHVSKPAMNIDGFGESMVKRFHEMGWLKNIADIYRLDYEQIAQLEGFGERSAQKLQINIDKAKKNPIRRFLHSLSIHHLGKKVSQLLAAEINHVLDLKDWSLEDFTNIKDVGPTVAENVTTYFQNDQNIELLKEIESLGVNLTQTEEDKPKVISADAPLIGKTILFTGKLLKMTRKEAQTKAENAGAKNISAVSSNLNILVAGEKAGSKLKKANALGTVQVLSEEEFLELIG
jgi:DNA ligase (NAD+)